MADEATTAAAATTPDSGAAPAVAPAPPEVTTILAGQSPTPPEPEKQGGDVQTEEAAKPTAPVVPEVYEFKVPEGFTLDQAVLDEFTPVLKELELPQDKAQKLVDTYSKITQAAAQKQQDDWVAQVNDWGKSVEKDPLLGGKNLPITVKDAQSAVARFGTNELKVALETTGLGNHPELVRFCAAVGKAMSEDTFHKVTAPGAERTREQILYPDMK
jgi:hypothetical protein